MIKISKTIFILLTIFAFNTLFSISRISAATVSPASGTYAPSATGTINVYAAPQTGELAVALKLNVTGMTITGFTPSAGWLVSVPDCSGGSASFTSTQVCHTFGTNTSIAAGTLLGTMNVTMQGTTGTATIANNATEYSDGVDSRTLTGTIATFTIASGGSGGILPDTGVGDFFTDNKFLFLGGTSLVIGLIAVTAIRRRNFEVEYRN